MLQQGSADIARAATPERGGEIFSAVATRGGAMLPGILIDTPGFGTTKWWRKLVHLLGAWEPRDP